MKYSKIVLFIFVLAILLSCKLFSFSEENSGVVYRIKVEPNNKTNSKTTSQAVKVFEKRLIELKVKGNVKVVEESDNSTILEIKVFTKDNLENIKTFLLYEANLELMKVINPNDLSELITYQTKEEASKVIENLETGKNKPIEINAGIEKDKWIIVEIPPIIDGESVIDATAEKSQNSSHYQIKFTLNKDGSEIFEKWTTTNIKNYIAMTLNDKAISVASIQSPIKNEAVLNGNFLKKEAQDLASILKSGHLPAKLTLLEEDSFDNNTH